MADGQVLVSLIIPVYNKRGFVARALESIAAQTDKSAQVIIVDDGSTDGGENICLDYAKTNNWEYYRVCHSGVAEARNYGLSKARGDYIAFLDADDEFTPDAIEIMTKIARHGYNIYQFGQYRHYAAGRTKDYIVKGHYSPNKLPRRWAMVWNKLYKKSFIDENQFKFKKGLQFGEDEIFNVECILANDGLYHAPQTLIEHHFDDKSSLCRGELSAERLEGLISGLEALEKQYASQYKRDWVKNKIREHEQSGLFKRFGYKRKASGKYDVVYFVKDVGVDEELRYSLRSLEENWQFNKVWFYGGCPNGLKPDRHVQLTQYGNSKWEKVHNMLMAACKNDEITENFWLFNDDFYILRPISEDMPPQYNGDLKSYVEKVDARHNGKSSDFTRRLRHLIATLEAAGKGTKNYAVHKPLLVNRKKMLEVLKKFPDEPMSRALYGNYWNIGGVSRHDMKIKVINYDKLPIAISKWDFLSTSDESFRNGNVGEFIRDRFKVKSRFEK